MGFVWGAVLGTITTTIFYFVDPDEVEQPDQKKHWYSAPLGAKLCDRLCFPAILALETPQPVQAKDANEEQVIEPDENNNEEQPLLRS